MKRPPAPKHWTIVGDGVPWLRAHEHTLILAAVGIAALILAADAARAWAKSRRRRARRGGNAERVLAGRLAPILGHTAPKDGRPARFLKCKGDGHGKRRVYRRVEARFPEAKTPTEKDLAHAAYLVGAHLGGEWVCDHRDIFRSSTVVFTPLDAPTLPASVAFADLPPSTRNRVSLGLAADGAPTVWDLTVEMHAHALIAGTTGSGKSNALRLLIAGLAANNILVDIIDAKGGEDFEDFEAHPGIRVHTDPADMVAALAGFRDEMDRRRPSRGAARAALPRRVLIIDETAEVKTAVRSLGEDVLKDYVTILLTVARLARSARMHLVLATQKPGAVALTGDPTSGAELRDLLGFKLGLGQLSRSASRMAFDADPPTVETITGRGVTYTSGVFTPVQTARLDLDEAVRVAASGTAAFPQPKPAPVPVDLAKTVPEPADTGPVQVTCACGNVFPTVAKTTTRCPACHKSIRIPAGARRAAAGPSTGHEDKCPEANLSGG